MQVSIETTSGLERVMTIVADAADLEKKVVEELKKISKGRSVPGFRKGKLTPGAAKKMFGKQARAEALYGQMYESFFQASQKENVSVAGYPKFDIIVDEEGKDLEFKATFDVYPDIELADLKDISVEKKTANIDDSNVDSMVENLRQQSASWDESDQAAASGDQAIINFEGFIDGEAFEGGQANDYTLNLGSNSMIAGFEDGVIGAKAGDELSLDLAFPDDYHKDELKGKAVNFKVIVNTVKKPNLPEVNEDFIKSYGVQASDVDGFKAELKTNMERELSRATRQVLKQAVIQGLLEKNSFDVPNSLVSQEIDQLRQQAVQQFGGQQPMDASMLPAELFKDQAENRVRVGLLFNALIEAQKIEASDEKVNELIEEMASGYEDPQEVRDYYLKNEEQKRQIESLAVEEQLVDLVMSQANVTETTASYEELVAAANARR